MAPDAADAHLSLDPVGLGVPASHLYRLLLRNQGLTVDQLATRSRLPNSQVQECTDELVRRGLASRATDESGRLYPTRPEDSLSALVGAQQSGLDRLRSQIAAFQSIYSDALPTSDANAFVEVLTDPDAVISRIIHLQATVERNILVFDRPPYVAPGEEVARSEQEQLERGIEIRVVYESSVLEDPVYGPLMRDMIRSGEQARVVDSLPAKLMLIDDRIAVAPLGEGESGRKGILLLTAAPMLALLRSLFEATWTAAVPLSADAATISTAAHTGGGGDLDGGDVELLRLVSSGLTDDAIARHLEVSRRTVQRRLQVLMRRFDATSRIQLVARSATSIAPAR